MLNAAPSPQMLEALLMSVSTISLGINGFFLKQVWDEMKEVKTKVDKHDGQIIRLETLQENGL